MDLKNSIPHIRAMPTPHQKHTKNQSEIRDLVDAKTIGESIGVSGRTILNWADSKSIPTALRLGKVVRFDPVAVAAALGLSTK